MEHFVFSRGTGLSGLLQNPFVSAARERVQGQAVEHICRHEGSCLKHALLGGAKGFAAGLSVTVTVALFRIIASKHKRQRVQAELRRLTRDKQLAKFLGMFVLTIKATNCLLRRQRRVDDGFNSIAAGSAAGFTLLLLKPGGFRSDISLYTLSRAFDAVVHILAGKAPAKNHFHYFWGVLIFMCLQGIIMHSYVLEARNLRASYNSWIALMAGKGVPEYLQAITAAVENNEQYVIPKSQESGVGGSSLLRSVRSSADAIGLLLGHENMQVTQTGQTPAQPAGASGAPQDSNASEQPERKHAKVAIHCSHFHASCLVQTLKTGSNAFKESLKMYLPLYLIPRIVTFLLSQKSRAALFSSASQGGTAGFLAVQKTLQKVLLSPLMASCRSALFIGGYTSMMFGSMCALRRFAKYESRWMAIAAGFLAGSPILIERPTRYAELNLYCLARAAETLYNNILEHWGRTSMKFVDTPLLDVMCFSWACGVLFWALQHQQSMVRKSMRSVLLPLLGVN